MKYELNNDRNRQQGAVLVVGLVLLVAMTLIGVTAMKLTTLDERIAGNAQQRLGTFQAAESVLKEAAVYDKVLSCSHEKCDCLPDKNPDKDNVYVIADQENCETEGYALSRAYPFGPDVEAGGETIPAIAGMKHEGDVNVFGNSIGVDTSVAGRLVRIRAVTGNDRNGSAAAVHDLLVAPVGLRNR